MTNSCQEYILPSKDSYPLSLRIYEAENPAAVVKIIHGMEEHQDRYRAFAEYLRASGFTVVTADLRGHGKNAPVLSHIADRDGHLRLLEDEQEILNEIRRRMPGLPVILFGHSMGTIIARAFLKENSRAFRKVVLSGYPNPNPAAGAGLLLTGLLSVFKGRNGLSGLVDGMVLGAFSRAVPDAKTPLDWLSVNEENVERYAKDPLCGKAFTLGSYDTLFRLIRMMGSPEGCREVNGSLPILLISGREDPCTGGEKGRNASEDCLHRAGFMKTETVLLDGMRHEILNETDREKVFRIILDFLLREE